jgi:hypothetical protein
MNDMPTHAFLLEDLPDVADWLRKLLQARFPGIHVTHASSLAEGKRALHSAPPAQLALVDLGLPDGDGTTLRNVPATLAIARRTRRIIRQNLMWALGYNLLALPLAATGNVTPWLAALGMALSSLAVTANALRLTRVPLP